MFLIAFEFTTPSTRQELSAEYYSKLQKIVHHQNGFISETAFASPTNQEKGLLFAKFEDEDSAQHWRRNHVHLKIQGSARHNIFSDYRLRVGPNTKSYTEVTGSGDLMFSAPYNSTSTGMLMVVEHPKDDIKSYEKVVTLVSGSPKDTSAAFTTYVNEAATIHLISWPEPADTAKACEFETSLSSDSGIMVYCMAVIRDYGKNHRDQAPEDADQLQAKYAFKECSNA